MRYYQNNRMVGKTPLEVQEIETQDSNLLTINIKTENNKLLIKKINYQILPLERKYHKFSNSAEVGSPKNNVTVEVDISSKKEGKYTAWLRVETINSKNRKRGTYYISLDFEKIEEESEEIWQFTANCSQTSAGSNKISCMVESSQELEATLIKQNIEGQETIDIYYGNSFEHLIPSVGNVNLSIVGVDIAGNESMPLIAEFGITKSSPILNIKPQIFTNNIVQIDLSGSFDPDGENLAQMEISYQKISGGQTSTSLAIDGPGSYLVELDVLDIQYLDIKVFDVDGNSSEIKLDLTAIRTGKIEASNVNGYNFQFDVSSFEKEAKLYTFYLFHPESGDRVNLSANDLVTNYTFEKPGVWLVNVSYKSESNDLITLGNMRLNVGDNLAPTANFTAFINIYNELILDMKASADLDGVIKKYIVVVETPQGEVLRPEIDPLKAKKAILNVATGFYKISLLVEDDKGMTDFLYKEMDLQILLPTVDYSYLFSVI